ncbi:MAG: hypothetical protein HQK52_15605 [Oligoflexia bacterium]|nr:hypothetical protein [Oligoflexia bacterium]
MLMISCLAIGCFSTKYLSHEEYLLHIPVPGPDRDRDRDPDPTDKLSIKKALLFVPQVTIDPPFNQLYFIYRTSDFQYLTDYYHSFMVSPEEQFHFALIKHLKQMTAFDLILSSPEMIKIKDTQTTLKLQTTISELYADYRIRDYPQARVSIHFSLTKIKPHGGKPIIVADKTLSTAIAMKAKDTESLLLAWNKCFQEILEQLLQQISH